MNFLSSMTVRGKLAFAFATVLALMLVLGGLTLFQLSRVNAVTARINDVRVSNLRDSGRMVQNATRLRTREYRLSLSKPEELPAVVKAYQDTLKDLENVQQSYAKNIYDAEEKRLFDVTMADWREYKSVSAKVIVAGQAGHVEETRQLIMDSIKEFDAMLTSMTLLTKYNDDGSDDDAVLAVQAYESARLQVVALLALAVAIATTLGWVITRSITEPLGRAVELARVVARGDLTSDVQKTHGRDELTALISALSDMTSQLRSVVTTVREGVESVSTAASQIATGNVDLSQRTEEQASNLQQTAAALEQLTSTVTQNADNARTAAQLAGGAHEVASNGGAMVTEMVKTMSAITEKSKRIADINGVIDSIAFQTNILALNAAVEAARAGEAGRGFAVVASEVRSLAQRCSMAAREIRELIQSSSETVAEGEQLASRTGENMSDLLQQVRRVNDLVGEISSACIEQAQGIGQVNDAMTQLDQVTQQNAALVEEAAAAAESMQSQAARLSETVSIFTVEAPSARPRASLLASA